MVNKLENKEEELKKCSFKPKINKSSSVNNLK